jgi:endonuclease IV
MKKTYFGYHVKLESMVDMYKFATETLETNTIQFYTRSPRMLSDKIKITDEDIKCFNNIRDENKFKIFTHAQYPINLCGGKTEKKSILNINEELSFLNKVKGQGCVVHIGFTTNQQNKYKIICNALKQIKYNDTEYGKLLIENQPYSNKAAISKIKDIVRLWKILPQDVKKNIGFCIDICHLFNTYNKLDMEFTPGSFLYLLIKKYKIPIYLIHLNNAERKLQDRHAYVYEGLIDTDLMKSIIKYSVKKNIPMINEMYSHYKKVQNKNIIIKKWKSQAYEIMNC